MFTYAALQEESGNKMEEDHGGWRRGALLIMAPRIPESERSAWRPLTADSSCISQPYEDGAGGGDGKWRGQ